MDEPTIGLDAEQVSRARVYQVPEPAAWHHRALTTHDMQDIEALAQRILLIGKGRILLDGTMQDLKAHAGTGKTLIFTYAGDNAPVPGLGMTIREHTPGRLTVAVDTARISVAQAIAQISAQAEITDMEMASVSAEEMVAGLYREYQI